MSDENWNLTLRVIRLLELASHAIESYAEH